MRAAVAELRAPLFAYCYRMLGRADDAEDAVQDTLLDITEPLGLPRAPVERVGVVLTNVDATSLAFFGVDLTGRRLVASDLDWSIGDGPDTVEASAAEHLLTITGRRPLS